MGVAISALPCQAFAQGAPPLPAPQPLTAPQAPAAPQAPGQPSYGPPPSQSAPDPQNGPSFIPEPPPNYDDVPSGSAQGYAGQPVRPDPRGYEDEVATEQAPPPPMEEPVPLAPAPNYVWAPGYWYWVGYQYTWVPGRWLTPHPGYFYVGPRWNYVGSRWAFRVGGWSVSVGGPVVYPVYLHSWGGPGYARRGYYAPSVRYYDPHPRVYGPRYVERHYDSPRYSAPAVRVYESPRYSAPRAAPSRVYVAPRAESPRYSAPRSDSPRYSAPRSDRGGPGPSRTFSAPRAGGHGDGHDHHRH
jgi:hypothetical protein